MTPGLFQLPKIDCHCHVFDPDTFPYADDVAYRPAGSEIALASYFKTLLDCYGVQHALLVQPNSGYNADNRCMLDAIANSNGKFKGIAIVPPTATAQELLDLKAQGIVGVAHNFAMLGPEAYAHHDAFWARLAETGLILQVQVRDDQMAALAPRLRASGATILIDHHGRPDISAGLQAPGFQATLALADTGRTFVKLSGYDKFSQEPYPFADAQPFSQALLAHFGPAHCVWASDWPHIRAVRRLDYGPLLHLFAQTVTNPADREAILFETPKKLFGFGI